LHSININYLKNMNRPYKKIFISLILCLFILFTFSYSYYRYNDFFNTFESDFTNYKFSEANNLIILEERINPFKIICLKDDLNSYFSDKLNQLLYYLENGNISYEDALVQLKEINHYQIVSKSKIDNINNYIYEISGATDYYTQGMNYYINNDYENAISCFGNINLLDINYSNSLIYTNYCKENIKKNIFSQCNELVENDYYTKALNLLSENASLINNDKDLSQKIQEIKTKRQLYHDDKSNVAEASSQALTTNITPSNINMLNIDSNTDFLINVDINSQKTYIYKGKSDNWTLIKAFPCSTGIHGEDTPSGSFSIKEKGDWFFSTEYNQGGKYWSQVTGDILFHSLPYAQDQTTIVDYTISKPSSHGCIRLYVDDSKWIYDNIPKDSKVIIK